VIAGCDAAVASIYAMTAFPLSTKVGCDLDQPPSPLTAGVKPAFFWEERAPLPAARMATAQHPRRLRDPRRINSR
jgi:hypothetical protein